MRWVSTRSRQDGSPTDTQAETKSRSPHQGAADDFLKSRSREEDAALRKWPKPRYRCASCNLETKTQVGSTAAKALAPRINPSIDEAPTAPKPHTRQSHECDGRALDPEATAAPPTPEPTRKAEALARTPPTIF